MGAAVQWPDWKMVEAGGKIADGHAVAWEKDPRRHPQRPVSRVMIRAEVLSQILDVGGYPCERGTNYLLVYEDELAGIRRQVATDDQKRRLADAERAFETALKAFARDKCGLGSPGTTDEEAWKKARETIGVSPFMLYSRAENGSSPDSVSNVSPGFPALIALDVCEERVKPPMNSHTYTVERDERMSAAIAEGIAIAITKLGLVKPEAKQRAT